MEEDKESYENQLEMLREKLENSTICVREATFTKETLQAELEL